MEGSKPTRRLLKLKAAAEYLSLSTWTLRRLIQEGHFKIVDYGEPNAAWLLDLDEINHWIDTHKRTV